MRKFLSFVWAVSVGVAIGSTGLWVGSITPEAAKAYAVAVLVSVALFVIGLIVTAIDHSAYSRGYETADSIRVKEQEARDG